VHHHTVQIKHQPDATIFQFIILTFIYNSTCFGHFPAHHQELNDCSGSLWLHLHIVVTVVLCSWSYRPTGRHFCNIRRISRRLIATTNIPVKWFGRGLRGSTGKNAGGGSVTAVEGICSLEASTQQWNKVCVSLFI
jgi:hypothetical protein